MAILGFAAETTDIRVGTYGKTYSTAGESVRTQLKNIDNSTDEAFETFNTDMIKFLSSIGAGK